MERKNIHILRILLVFIVVTESRVILPKRSIPEDGDMPLSFNKDKRLLQNPVHLKPWNEDDEFDHYDSDMEVNEPSDTDYNQLEGGVNKPGIIRPEKIPPNEDYDEKPDDKEDENDVHIDVANEDDKISEDEGFYEPFDGEEDADKSMSDDNDFKHPVEEDEDEKESAEKDTDDEEDEEEEERDEEEENDDKKIEEHEDEEEHDDEDEEHDEEEHDDDDDEHEEERDDDDDDEHDKEEHDDKKIEEDHDNKEIEEDEDDKKIEEKEDDKVLKEDENDKEVPEDDDKNKHIPGDGEEKPDEEDMGNKEDEEHIPESDDEKSDENEHDKDDENIGEGKESGFPIGGSIFDTPIFNINQVQKYFNQLERVLGHVFRDTLDEALLLNGTYANTTEEEVEIDGKKFIVQKSIIKGGDNHSSIYVEALSSKRKLDDVKGIKDVEAKNVTDA